jgi:signal transduction histidine kinase
MVDASVRTIGTSSRAVIAAAILLSTLIFFAAAWRDYDVILSEAQESVNREVEVLYRNAVNTFETLDLIAERVNDRIRAMSWEDIAASTTLQRYLRELRQKYPQIEAIRLVDSSGIVRDIDSLAPPSAAIVEGNQLDTFRQRGSSTLVGHLLDRANFDIVQRRQGEEDAFAGLVVVTASPRYFADFWREIVPHDSVTGLLQSDGVILARHPPLTSEMIRLPPGSFSQAAAERGLLRSTSGLDELDRIYGFRNLPGYPVSLVYGISVAAAAEQWRGDIVAYGILYTFTILAITLGMLLVSSQRARERLAWSQANKEANQRAATETELHRLQKMDVIGQFTSGMAHDFGNVLAGIAMHISTLNQPESDRKGFETAVQDALRGVDQGIKIVRSLLDLVRHQTSKSESLDVNGCLRAAEGLLRQCMQPLSSVVLDLAPEVWIVDTDAQSIELALLNLAINARDAMPSGGTLRITTRNTQLWGKPGGLFGDYVALDVADTGTGMDSQVLAHAFEPFFTTKPDGKGTGLGLSQVFQFAEQSGGTATIATDLRSGTTVTIYVPRSRRSKLQVRLTPRHQEPSRTWRVVRADPSSTSHRRGFSTAAGPSDYDDPQPQSTSPHQTARWHASRVGRFRLDREAERPSKHIMPKRGMGYWRRAQDYRSATACCGSAQVRQILLLLAHDCDLLAQGPVQGRGRGAANACASRHGHTVAYGVVNDFGNRFDA